MTFDVAYINERVKNNRDDFITECENKHQIQYKKVLNMLHERLPKIKIVCVAGPSSSGKTTFSKNLHGLMRKANILNDMISLDDYFKNRDEIPLQPDGTPDFESIECVDREMFNKDLKNIISGKPTMVPRYNFNTGRMEKDSRLIDLNENGVIFIEGIHALNYDALFDFGERDQIFGIFICPEDNYKVGDAIFENHQTRLLRRIVRDVYYRNSSLMNTLDMWESVRRGEFQNIFPYKSNSDVTFNSSLAYEINILKDDFMEKYNPLSEDEKRIVRTKINPDLIEVFESIPDSAVPKYSLLKEFILTE